MKRILSFLDSYTLPVLTVGGLVGIYLKWGIWGLVAGIGSVVALFFGILVLHSGLRSNVIYWSVVSAIGGTAYYLKTHSGGTLAVVFTAIVAIVVLGIVFALADYLVKGKYK